MKRVFYHFSECEEFEAGMWRLIHGAQREGFVQKAGTLMADPPAFLEAMMRAVREWPRSCAANLSAPSINRRAWLGHAGCLLGTGSPEELTRLGWHTLTEPQQDAANAAADEAIAEWERAYRENGESIQLLLAMGIEDVA